MKLKKEEIEILTAEQEIEFGEAMETRNNLEYNTLKLIEELGELSTLLVKSITKGEEHKPTNEELAEEFGDVFIRIAIYMGQQPDKLYEFIEDRINEKTFILYRDLKTHEFGKRLIIENNV